MSGRRGGESNFLRFQQIALVRPCPRILRAGMTPILEKMLRECRGQMKVFHVGAHQSEKSARP